MHGQQNIKIRVVTFLGNLYVISAVIIIIIIIIITIIIIIVVVVRGSFPNFL